MPEEEQWVVADADVSECPRYCPRCDRAAVSGVKLCQECGGILRAEGYCTVCECFWRRAPGEDCPKHEIPLEECAPSAPALANDAALDWTTVATYADVLQASAPQLRLEAEGIPTFLDGEHMGVNTIYQVATGGVKLQVPRESLDEARVILSQVWTPPVTADDLDDAWDDLAPAPWDARRRVMKGVILLILLWPFLYLVATLLSQWLGVIRQMFGRG